MGKKKKLFRFADIKIMPCVFEPTMDDCKSKNYALKGNWRSTYFKNDNPLILELGCGKGEYSVGLGKKYPDKNYLGIDIKGARIWYGAKTVMDEKLPNIAFLRTRIDFIDAFFGPDEVDEIWLTFSDPQPQKPNKRLSSKHFVELYKKFLKPGGLIHLKTDNDLLFESTLEQIQEHGYTLLEKTWDLYGEMPESLDADTREILTIRTYYEQLFSAKGFKIKYCRFKVH
ncbi:MAG: tRNA (guanosine(46)-N7)-methyltransferase TrmB [Bacteroidetes bacterium]|nr:tRNA (guanosine(46)-N7)-methyltransferase TrmB [Bacteroidota bacterium]